MWAVNSGGTTEMVWFDDVVEESNKAIACGERFFWISGTRI